jgi:hypothetical protein
MLILTSAHLLGNHDDTACLRSTSDSRNGEQLAESREEVVSGAQADFSSDDLFLAEESVSIVKIASSLEWIPSKTDERT